MSSFLLSVFINLQPHLILYITHHQVGFSPRKRKTKLEFLLLSPPMAAPSYAYTSHSSSQRSTAMVLALVSAIVLSPLYVTTRKTDARYYETKWSSGFVLPMVLAGLIIAIKTTSSSSSSSSSSTQGDSFVPSPEPSWVLRIGSSSWGLAGVLVLLMLVLSWQGSVHEFLWR